MLLIFICLSHGRDNPVERILGLYYFSIPEISLVVRKAAQEFSAKNSQDGNTGI
ncbi:hypothetical protein [Nostoc sp. NMS4]|uniref:hypothetical protein n=1 Tax=Nostoc sp. NMS4 TaxID=2815390 RepID=UPI0025E23049|nr:hypothetical protein [Nostoc sp. NMS4]MBN3925935.1 hypothetical protein [Nostoc sp. NMS4]